MAHNSSPSGPARRPYSLLIDPALAGGARVSPNGQKEALAAAARGGHSPRTRRREQSAAAPVNPLLDGRDEAESASASPSAADAVFIDGRKSKVFDTRTGKRQTGLPRFIITAKSSEEDVSLWLISIGLVKLVSKFSKKKVNGTKLFLMTEKQCRKLVKVEDDFVLFKRALRQAVAYAATAPTMGSETLKRHNNGEFQGEDGKSPSRKPFRSVHKKNPVYKPDLATTSEEA